MNRKFPRWIGAAIFGCSLAVFGIDQDTDFSFEGEVTTSKLHVRSGPGKNFTSLMVADKGERLTVIGKQGTWYKVQLPRGCRLWVTAKFVEWKEGQESGTITGDRVNLRAEASPGAETLAQLSKGAFVKVFKKSGEWLEVETTDADLSAWVAAQYVKRVGPAERDSQEWFSLRKQYDQEMAKPVAQRDLGEVLARTEALAKDSTKNQRVRERAVLFLTGLRQQAEVSRKISATEKEREEEMRRIQEEYRNKLKELLEKTQEPSSFLLTGWLYECGNVIGGTPGTHKLVKGGKVIAYVRGNNVDLKKYYGKYVGVNGEDSFHPKYQEPVVVLQAAGQIQVIGTGTEE